jgi:hypothetical protein
MIIEITLGPGEAIDELQPIKDAVRALGHRVDFIEIESLTRAKDYNWKLEVRSPGAAEQWRNTQRDNTIGDM